MSHAPKCVGIILDGNRRWAREQGLPTFEGHRRGMENIEPIVLAARDFGIEHLIVYAFSTENWARSFEEISYIMHILEYMSKDMLNRFTEESIAVHFIGQREQFSKLIQRIMQNAEEINPKNPKINLWVCMSYGGRADIIQAARSLSVQGNGITEESLSNHLWTGAVSDPDLIIRTGGDYRVSNFLLWQGAYSELFFPKVYWPAFTKGDLELILEEFASRERRRGK